MASFAAPSRQPYVVGRPRASDAIGTALRTTYCGNGRLPDDIGALLQKLNAVGTRRD